MVKFNAVSAALGKTSDELMRPFQKGSAAARIYSQLRERIISLALLPHTVLSRAALAKEYGVSQSPVREAIQKLEQEGLVISYPQSKTLVSEINVAHARETQLLRLSVELEVAKMLARKQDPERLQPSYRILTMQKITGEDRDIPEFEALDRLFHLSLFQAAGVPALWYLISGRSGHIDRLRRLNLPDLGKIASVLASHEGILSAISQGDLDAVEKHVREHLAGTLASLPTIKKSHPEYFGENELRLSD